MYGARDLAATFINVYDDILNQRSQNAFLQSWGESATELCEACFGTRTQRMANRCSTISSWLF